jgi:hypothetical protein
VEDRWGIFSVQDHTGYHKRYKNYVQLKGRRKLSREAVPVWAMNGATK